MHELPDDVIDEAVRLTRLATRATDDDEAAAYRRERDRLVDEHGFTARVRREEAGAVLVLYPAEWLRDGTVRTDRIDDLGRAVERRLSGTVPEDEWETVDARNRELVGRIKSTAGSVHAANAAAFADFMGNHYVKPMETATDAEVDEFLTEYFPRNAWPSDEQREIVEESIRLVFAAVNRPPPDRVSEN